MIRNFYIIIIIFSTLIFLMSFFHKKKVILYCVCISLFGYVAAYMFYVSGQVLTPNYDKTISAYKEKLDNSTRARVLNQGNFNDIVLLNKNGSQIQASSDKDTKLIKDSKNYVVIEKRIAVCPKFIFKKLWKEKVRPINVYKEIHY